MTVEIPICENHAGSPLAIMKVSISDYCPKCGKKNAVLIQFIKCEVMTVLCG